MKNVKLKVRKIYYGFEKKPGEIIPVRDDIAKRWIAQKEAIELKVDKKNNMEKK